MIGQLTRISIVAPNASAAFLLEQRLVHCRPVTIGRGEQWYVELEDDADRADEIAVAVTHWLRDIGKPSAEMHVDGTTRVVHAVTFADSPLGVGYDARGALEHEP